MAHLDSGIRFKDDYGTHKFAADDNVAHQTPIEYNNNGITRILSSEKADRTTSSSTRAHVYYGGSEHIINDVISHIPIYEYRDAYEKLGGYFPCPWEIEQASIDAYASWLAASWTPCAAGTSFFGHSRVVSTAGVSRIQYRTKKMKLAFRPCDYMAAEAWASQIDTITVTFCFTLEDSRCGGVLGIDETGEEKEACDYGYCSSGGYAYPCLSFEVPVSGLNFNEFELNVYATCRDYHDYEGSFTYYHIRKGKGEPSIWLPFYGAIQHIQLDWN